MITISVAEGITLALCVAWLCLETWRNGYFRGWHDAGRSK